MNFFSLKILKPKGPGKFCNMEITGDPSKKRLSSKENIKNKLKENEESMSG